MHSADRFTFLDSVGGNGLTPFATVTESPDGLELTDVARLRETVAARLEAAETADRVAERVLSGEDERARAKAVIDDELEAWVIRRGATGEPPLSFAQERALADAVFAALYGLGRIQPLLDREDVENVHIHGCDRVALELADGTIEWWPYPVAASDAELVATLATYAARLGQTSREFSQASPILNLRLPAGGPLGSRLAAVMEVTDRPRVTIRRYRLVETTLDTLVENGTLDTIVRDFLAAAVKAGKNLIVSGGPAAGKTTLLRALCHEIRPEEHLVTVEDEYELGLHLTPARHPLVSPFEARLPNAEGVGEIDLDTLLKQALRHSPSRVIVGEVRAGEVTAMLRALGNGAAGGMCTLHAASATDVLDRIASLGQLARPPLPIEAAYRWIASAIDLVVHVRKVDHHLPGDPPRRERMVSEILEVGQVGDSGRPDITRVFAPSPDDGRAKLVYPPSRQLADDLRRAGFEQTAFAGGPP